MIDARGYACPMPVVLVQKAVQENNPDILEVLVDDPYAVENISRFANNHGYSVEVQRGEENDKLVLKRLL